MKRVLFASSKSWTPSSDWNTTAKCMSYMTPIPKDAVWSSKSQDKCESNRIIKLLSRCDLWGWRSVFQNMYLECCKWSILCGAYYSSKGSTIAQLESYAIRVKLLNLRHNSILHWWDLLPMDHLTITRKSQFPRIDSGHECWQLELHMEYNVAI